ncbi:MAG: hypothetical protein QOH61_1754 [Chloroflexota bacterium]|jgi:adenylate kinase family enzyme|nr:hypothetical protein [Chloroflexota bacterium]
MSLGSDRVASPGAAVGRFPGPRRIHVIGGPGSGKTSLATRLAARTGLPVHSLDDVARIGGGNGPMRSPDERAALVAGILAADGWITEGVHLRWTDSLLERADLIVWLDYVSSAGATGRVLRRFVAGAIHEVRHRPMRERFTRFRDYGRQLRNLGGAIRETRDYYADGGATLADHTAGAVSPADGAQDSSHETTAESRARTREQLAPFASKVVHCRDAADVAKLLERLG